MPADTTTETSNLYKVLELEKTGYDFNKNNGSFPKKIPSYNVTWLANQIKNNAVDYQTTVIAKDLLDKMYNFNTTYGTPFQTAMNSMN